jgi:uncharacterized protein YndB with AHSA1/START domain
MSAPIVVERLVAAPPSAVYAHLTVAEKWAMWQGTGANLEARPGGIFSLAMPNGSTARGEFVELETNRRVVFTWGWVDHPGVPPGSSTVEIELIAEGQGTRIRLTHRELPDDEIPPHTAGWEYYLPRLATVAQGNDPGPDPGPG